MSIIFPFDPGHFCVKLIRRVPEELSAGNTEIDGEGFGSVLIRQRELTYEIPRDGLSH
jgi:hypothetical protein